MRTRSAILIILSLLLPALSAGAGTDTVLSISGTVNHPLGLTMADLERFTQTDVQINDIRRDGGFQGVFNCRGVSLKTLLSIAAIEKKETDFKKQVDLAVVVKNRSGNQITLSWGEIYYKNPDEIIVAVSSSPIFPHHGIDHFSDKAAYGEMMKTLNREVGLPRLIVRGDLFSDRSLESISEIIVVDVRPKVEGKKSPSVFSENFRIVQTGAPETITTQLPEGINDTVELHVVGEGRGYHGTHRISGAALKKLMEPYKAAFGLNTVFIVSAPDAYRTLISYGELFLNPQGERIMIADQVDDKPIGANGGRFILYFPDDLMADREIKAVGKIEIMNPD